METLLCVFCFIKGKIMIFTIDWAVINKKLEIIAVLLDNKCDCSIANIFGKTPLDEALHLGFDNIAVN